jgi:tetratricopeptide (TPR) repeat protein
VLGIAAAFEDIFPHRLLMALAEQEGLTHADGALQALVQQRFLLTGDEGASLWLSPVLRGYIYARQAPADCQRRHRQIALAYERQGLTLPAARHWQRAEQDARAARILLPAVPALIHELQAKGLVDLLQQLEVKRLEDDQRFAIHLLLSDLFQRGGQHEEALGACRQALKATLDPTQQARVYRRMGKLYEGRNGLHALRYYQQAVERFAPGDPELAELYKDRGWLYFYRQEWTQAEQDLQQALHCTPEAEKGLQADIYDAMANLYRKRQQPDQALRYAERALAIREEVGDLLRVAKSLGNLGFLYRTMGEYSHAVAAHQEALETYGRLGNQELMAAAWLNIGAVQFLANQLEAALESYRQSLHICQSLELPLVELKAHYNLAEALAAAGRQAEALRHWQSGHRLCLQHSFDDQLADFLALGQALDLVIEAPATNGKHSPHPLAHLTLDADEDRVLKLARSEQILTPKRLMQAANISRATATRWLTSLVEKGWLTAQGKGRGAHYLLAEASTTPMPQRIAVAEPATNIIPSVLCQAQSELTQCHAVGALGLAPMEPNSRYLKIVVRFTSLPTLEHYLALKQALAAMVQMDVDLLPEIGPAPAVADRDIQWLW